MGTTIRTFLPRSGLSVDQAEPVTHARVPTEPGGRILVVEDSPDVLKVTVRILQRLGYDTVSATSVSEAAERLAGPDDLCLVLTDVVLAGASGIELGRAVEQKRPGTPVVYMSGYSGDVLAKEGSLPQGLDLIQKPFRPEDLATRITAALGRRNQE